MEIQERHWTWEDPEYYVFFLILCIIFRKRDKCICVLSLLNICLVKNVVNITCHFRNFGTAIVLKIEFYFENGKIVSITWTGRIQISFYLSENCLFEIAKITKFLLLSRFDFKNRLIFKLYLKLVSIKRNYYIRNEMFLKFLLILLKFSC